MFARNANLTPGQVLTILTSTASDISAGDRSVRGGALRRRDCSTRVSPCRARSRPSTRAPGTVPVVEYYRADKDHYFMTADPGEIDYIDTVLGIGLPAYG